MTQYFTKYFSSKSNHSYDEVLLQSIKELLGSKDRDQEAIDF